MTSTTDTLKNPGLLQVQHEERACEGTFFIESDGRRIAEQLYLRVDDHRVDVARTWVDPALRGHGVARQLVAALVAWARTTSTRISATCSYTASRFARDAPIRDVYVHRAP